MANTTWYGDGTATVAVGSRTVTGTDTGWLTEVAGLTPIKVGDKYGIHVGRPIVIEQIISDTELLLADDWPGPAQTDAPYKVELTSPTIAAVEAMRRLLASLSNGNLDSLSEITVGTDDIPIGIGPGVFGTINKFTLKDGVQFDVAVPNMAGRAAYNGAAAGFRVLVADIGDGRSALYIKNSATSGDWSVPYYITGPVGPAGVNQRGNYSAGTAYAIRDIVQYGGSTWIAKVATTGNAPPTLPTTENTQWLLFARSGTAGVVDRGAYSAGAAYATNDIALDNGSTWIAIQPTTGNAPPVLPVESNAYWRLLARKGTDGTGTGDVTGAASAVDGQFAVANGTTGKSIKFLTPAQASQALGGWEPIGLINMAGLTTAVITNLSAFSRLRCTSSFSVPSGTYLTIQVSTDNGVTFLSAVSDYEFTLDDAIYNGSTTTSSVSSAQFPGIFVGDITCAGTTEIFNFNKARPALSIGQFVSRSPTSRVNRTIGTTTAASVARNALRIQSSVAAATYGELFFEGVRG
ncbi:fusion protein [Agrobacterium radiobacter]|uniref:Putative fusion protein n=1 Tax=Agrobacterium tumefaciens str. B6 TaxID=1183423 RepID=A0A822UWX7_AGRTU|nr:fusion protein [Agrobacterium tumefaciens]MQB28224.1 fusion protein [Agrobacterium tumefaciens]CVI15199.1 putative fusion protein [Agrobacterium tumefaciens str. B6]SPZ35383.1 Carbohydrate binding domain [Agrobacterium tumefaciens]